MAQAVSLATKTESLSHVHSLVESFRAFDSDSDGSITSAELGGIMASLGYNPTEPEVTAMMSEGDADKDGLLSLEEFLALTTKDLDLGELGNVLVTATEALGAEADAVTGEELFQVLGSLGFNNYRLEDCLNIIASMDMDDDGAVSIEDFNLIVNSLL